MNFGQINQLNRYRWFSVCCGEARLCYEDGLNPLFTLEPSFSCSEKTIYIRFFCNLFTDDVDASATTPQPTILPSGTCIYTAHDVATMGLFPFNGLVYNANNHRNMNVNNAKLKVHCSNTVSCATLITITRMEIKRLRVSQG